MATTFSKGQKATLLTAPVEVRFESRLAPGHVVVRSDYSDREFHVPAALLEPIVEPLKVGDEITTVAEKEALPIGAVVQSGPFMNVRVYGGFMQTNGFLRGKVFKASAVGKSTVLSLPESS